MASLEELYALTQKDQRFFFPGSFGTSENAARVLLAPGCRAEWTERGSVERPRCGFLRFYDAAGTVVTPDTPAFASAITARTPAEAWAQLVASPALDPAYMGSLEGRLVDGEPRTFAAALALASAPKVMREAEVLVADAFRRAAPFGVGPCPPIAWRSSDDGGRSLRGYDRSAFGCLDHAILAVMAYSTWMRASYPPQRWFSFSSAGGDLPDPLQWPAADMGKALQFDLAQEELVVTAAGVAFADQWNPYEMLLRIAKSGIAVEKVTPELVVLVAI